MDDLPSEVVSHILSFSHEDSAAALVTKRLVCQRWRELIDSCSSIWSRFTELSIIDSKITPAELEHRCSFMVRPEKIQLVRCPNVVMSALSELLSCRRRANLKEIHIENCNNITSKDVSLASLINECPQLETLVFMSSNYHQESKVSVAQLQQNEDELIHALAQRGHGNPLKLLRTNVVRPSKKLLKVCAASCLRFEWEDMPRDKPDLGEYFTDGKLLVTYDPYMDKYWCIPGYVGCVGWAKGIRQAEVQVVNRPTEKVVTGYVHRVGTQHHHALRREESVRSCSGLIMEKKQLLMLSDDGFASLMDANGSVTEDTPVPVEWHQRIHQALTQDGEVWLAFLHVLEYDTTIFASVTSGDNEVHLFE